MRINHAGIDTMSSSTAAGLSARRAVNVSISSALIDEARSHKLNLSRVLEEALETRLQAARARQWQEENREALVEYNERVERDGPWNKDLIGF